MVMQPKSSATVVRVLAGTSSASSVAAAAVVMAASVVSGRISEIAPTVVVLPTPKPPAMTSFTGRGGRRAPATGSAEFFERTDHPFDHVQVVGRLRVRALHHEAAERREV